MIEPPLTVLLVGCFHFDNPGRDQFNLLVDNVKADRRQHEIEELVRSLARFRPTKVAVEVDVSDQSALQRDYKAFVAGSFDLPPDEEYQLGFRLAGQAAPH